MGRSVLGTLLGRYGGIKMHVYFANETEMQVTVQQTYMQDVLSSRRLIYLTILAYKSRILRR